MKRRKKKKKEVSAEGQEDSAAAAVEEAVEVEDHDADAALLAADHAEEATIVFREPRWPVPSVLLGGIPFKYALFNRFTNAMLPLHMHASRIERIFSAAV